MSPQLGCVCVSLCAPKCVCVRVSVCLCVWHLLITAKYLCIVKVSNRCQQRVVAFTAATATATATVAAVVDVVAAVAIAVAVVRCARKSLTFLQCNNRILWGNLSG